MKKTKYILLVFNVFFILGLFFCIYKINTKADNTLKGKTCACFGDSITWYDGNVYNTGKQKGEVAIGYETYLRKDLGMEVDNFGYSGATMPEILKREILYPEEYECPVPDFTKYDFITITSGANDERCNTPLGEVMPIGSDYDPSTFIGALQSALDYILSINSDVKIILCTPIQGWIYAPNGYVYERDEDGIVTSIWADAIKEVAKLYSLPVCDWYYESGINILTRNIYINDFEPITVGGNNTYYSLHPTTAGYKRMADILIGVLKTK